MDKKQSEILANATAEFTAHRFERAASLVMEAIQSAAGSPDNLKSVGQFLVNSGRLQPIFRNTEDMVASGAFYDAVAKALEDALGADDLIVAMFFARSAMVAAARANMKPRRRSLNDRSER